MPVGAAVSAGGSILGGGLQALGGFFGSQAQTQYGQQAISAIQQMFGQAQSALSPFYTTGANALQGFMSALPGLTTPFGATPGSGPGGQVNPTQTLANLQSTPGYQFSLQQGTQAATNAATAQGLGGSGNMLKGVTNYAEGLANTTYQQQYQNYLQQQQQNANLLYQPVNTGASAAGSLASAAGTAGTGISNAYQGIGQAQAGAYTLAGNAIGGGVAGAGNTFLQYNLLQSLLNRNSLSPGGGSNYYGGSSIG